MSVIGGIVCRGVGAVNDDLERLIEQSRVLRERSRRLCAESEYLCARSVGIMRHSRDLQEELLHRASRVHDEASDQGGTVNTPDYRH